MQSTARLLRQRTPSENAAPARVPPVVRDVLASPGKPLTSESRHFMEPRFGHDFSRVRVHTNVRAAASAEAVGALAYTFGSHIVFGAGQYSPASSDGRHLLAHELAHVDARRTAATGTPTRISSPTDSSEVSAERTALGIANGNSAAITARGAAPAGTLMRTVGRSSRCPANTNGAPDDPTGELQANDARAQEVCQALATAFADDAREAAGGVPDAPSATFQVYEDHFGIPIAEGKGFLNRLTGNVRPTQAIALQEELRILSRRFALVARLFSQPLTYICIGGPGARIGSCVADGCDVGDAETCGGTGGMFLCPSFWTGFDAEGRAGVMIHEAFHIVFVPAGGRQTGEIGDNVQRGPGRNFNVAGCYEAITNDVFGIDSHFSCPDVP